MADLDPCELHSELQRKKATSFVDFVFGGSSGGDGCLDAKLMETANLTCLDMRYRVLQKGTRLYTKRSGDDRVLVFSTTFETLMSVLEPHLEEWRESEEVACFRVFETTQDFHVVEVQEDIAKEVSLLWCLSASKETTTKASEISSDNDGQTEATSAGADPAEAASAGSGKERLMYKRLLNRSDRTSKNLLDHAFSTLFTTSAILFRRPESQPQSGILTTVNNMGADFIRVYQSIIVPQKLVDRLTTDSNGYLELRPAPQGPTSHVQQNSEDGVDGLSVSSEPDVLETDDQPAPAIEPIPNFDDIPRIEAEDAMDDYASIQFTTPSPSKTTTAKATTAIAPGLEAAKPLSPRPGQPPPPPVAEPVYGTVDKPGKKPRQARMDSLDLPDAPGGIGLRPPRPPPVDSMPHDTQHATSGHSPAQILTGSHSPAPAQINANIKPSRPSAPPKLKGTERAMSVDSVSMGSSGNVSLDGKDDSLVPPPRGKTKKGDSTRF